MIKGLEIKQYDPSYFDKWDKFVLTGSINGTFLQSRKFLSYHPDDRFEDASLMVFKGNEIVAVIPANCICDSEEKIFISHQGSTFGGVILGKNAHTVDYVESIISLVDDYFIDNSYSKVVLKQTSTIFQNSNSELIDYFLFRKGYHDWQEVGFFIDFTDYNDDIISNFTASRRRDYRYSLKNNLSIRKLDSTDEISEFYGILCDNYKKFDETPVHSLEDLLVLKLHKISNNTDFYGIYLDDEMIAGSMVFLFDNRVFHTQYLAVRQDMKDIFVSEFMYKELIDLAKREGFRYLSFGTSTFDGGRILNKSLAQYKEGFGAKAYVNRTYRKTIGE